MTEGAAELASRRTASRRRRRVDYVAAERRLEIRPVVVVVIFLEFAASLIFWLLWSSGDDAAGFAAVGLLIAIMTQFPFVLARHELFSIWGMVALAVTIGSGVRGIFIAIGYPSRDFVSSFFLGGATFSGLFGPSMVAMASVGVASVGYMFAARRRRSAVREPELTSTDNGEGVDGAEGTPRTSPSRVTWLLNHRAPEGFVVALAAFYAGVGTLAMIAYTRGVGGLGGSISQRRGTVAADGSTTGTFGYYQFLAEASTIGAMILLAYWLATRKRLGLARMLILGAFFIDALALNWVTTTRSEVVYLAAAVFAVVQIVRGRVSWLGILVAGLVVLLAIGVLTASRSSSQDGNGFSLEYGLNSGLLNRNGYDLGKTIRVVQAVPEVLPYQNGATITVFALAPIPRSIWPGKPIISPGREVGQLLYDTTQSGVPPGLTGELVWNWGSTMAIVLSFVVGLGLGWLERRFRPTDPGRTAMVVFYAVVLFTLGKNVFGVSVGQAMITAIEGILLLIPAAILTRLATRSAHRAAIKAQARSRRGSRRVARTSGYRLQ